MTFFVSLRVGSEWLFLLDSVEKHPAAIMVWPGN